VELLIEEIKCLIAEYGAANRRKKILAIASHRVNEHRAVLGDRRKTFFVNQQCHGWRSGSG